MRFGVLGPLLMTIDVGGETRSVLPSATKQQVLLACLLSRAGYVVSTDSLICEVWPHDPPDKPRGALHVYMTQLRGRIGAGSAETAILTEAPGYRLELGRAVLDLAEFQGRLDGGQAALERGQVELASERLHESIALWRGKAFAGLTDGPMLSMTATTLDESYVAALDLRIEADLALGRHSRLIGELIALVHEHPLREGFYRQLMLAYYRSDRQGEALACYRALRERLQEELGVDPCRSVRVLHHAMLTSDPQLDLVDLRERSFQRVRSA